MDSTEWRFEWRSYNRPLMHICHFCFSLLNNKLRKFKTSHSVFIFCQKKHFRFWLQTKLMFGSSLAQNGPLITESSYFLEMLLINVTSCELARVTQKNVLTSQYNITTSFRSRTKINVKRSGIMFKMHGRSHIILAL